MFKSTKKLSAMFLVAIMAMGLFFSVNAKANTVIPVKIQMTGMRGANSTETEVIREGTVTLTAGMTAFDAIKAIAISSGDTQTTDVVGNKTYYNKGLLRWYESNYGPFISAIKVPAHTEDNMYFGENGSAMSSEDSTIAGNRGSYFKLNSLSTTESNLHFPTNGTWSNQVNLDGYVSEKDYNSYSGWMLLINGNTYNDGLTTTLTSETTSVTLDFSMMMGLDLGQSSYMQDYVSHEWVPVSAWN